MKHTIHNLCLALTSTFAIGSLTAQNATITHNNNQLIQQQQEKADPSRPGAVRLSFYGHNAFKITTPGTVTVLFDPWRNDPSGAWGKWFPNEFPQIPVDVTVSTHAHFDHDAVDRPDSLMVLERLVGDFSLGDMAITGLADKHQCHSAGDTHWDNISSEFGIELCPPNNALAFDNTIQILQTGGLRIAVWGDNRPRPSASLDKYLKDVDILILPIDGSQHILTYGEIDAIIKRYTPKAVIPAHYLVKHAESVLSSLQNADSWVNRQPDVRRLTTPEMTFSTVELRGASGRVYYFGDHYLTR